MLGRQRGARFLFAVVSSSTRAGDWRFVPMLPPESFLLSAADVLRAEHRIVDFVPIEDENTPDAENSLCAGEESSCCNEPESG